MPTLQQQALAIFKLKDVYGRTLAYPLNDAAVYVCRLTGNKTLRAMDLPNIVGLGFLPVTEHGERIIPEMI